MEPASLEDSIEYFRSQAHPSGGSLPGWPDNVRSIGGKEAWLFLGIDDKNQLYWNGKPVEIQRRLKFSRLQIAGAVIVGLATLIGGVGTGINEGFDFGCKVHLWSERCPQ